MEATSSEPTRRVALVCCEFTMQSAFALFILALNAARLNYETFIYFTFEGLNMIRPGNLSRLRYIPSGIQPSEDEVDKLTEELRGTMYDRDIPFIEDMMEMAQLEGVQFLACKTSADLFGLTEEDFLEGVQVMLAEDFMKKASGSDLHLVF